MDDETKDTNRFIASLSSLQELQHSFQVAMAFFNKEIIREALAPKVFSVLSLMEGRGKDIDELSLPLSSLISIISFHGPSVH